MLVQDYRSRNLAVKEVIVMWFITVGLASGEVKHYYLINEIEPEAQLLIEARCSQGHSVRWVKVW